MRTTLLAMLLCIPQEAEVDKLVRELPGASIERRDEIVAALVKLGPAAEAGLRKHLAEAKDADLKGVLAGAMGEIVAAPLRTGVKVLYKKGEDAVVLDLATGRETVAAKKVEGWQFHPADRSKVLYLGHEDLLVGDLAGNTKSIVHKALIVHPGCGHIESSLHGARWVDGGDAILFGYRQVPKGVDPHEHSDEQMKRATVKPDGTGETLLEARTGLHSDHHNVGLPDMSPDATKAIVSRRSKALQEGAEVEVLEERLGRKETRAIATLELQSLGYLGGEWSPDSSKYFFYHTHKADKGRGTLYDLHLWDGACTKVATSGRLGLGGTGGYVLSWSPDSSRVAWLSDHNAKKATLCVLDVKRKQVKIWSVEHPSGPELGKPVWSADSRRVAALSQRCPMEQSHQHRFIGCRRVLCLFDLDAENPRVIEGPRFADRAPASSADGRHFYVFTITSETPKGKGDVWDEPASQELDLSAIDARTGESVPVTKSRAFGAVSEPVFLFPKRP